MYNKVIVETPITKTKGINMNEKIIIVPILRAGLGLIEGFVSMEIY